MFGIYKSAPLNRPPVGASLDLLSIRARARAILGKGEELGGSLLEFALVLPLLLLLTTSICVFGIAWSNYLCLTDATNLGARAIAISRGQTTDPCAVGSSMVIAASPQLNSANLSFTYQFSGATYTGTSCSQASSTATSNLVQGQPVVLTVTYPCKLGVYGKNYLPNCLLTAQITELAQ